jgi:hypothetical protein
MKSPCGVSSSMRIAIAYRLPMKKKKLIATRYSRPIRLWSFVKSQDFKPCSAFR